MAVTLCLECHRELELQEPQLGQRINCPYCHTRLEVLNLEPLELDWVYNEPQLIEIWSEIERWQG